MEYDRPSLNPFCFLRENFFASCVVYIIHGLALGFIVWLSMRYSSYYLLNVMHGSTKHDALLDTYSSILHKTSITERDQDVTL